MLFEIIIASIIVSLISFSGAILFVVNEKKLNPYMILIVAFAAGTLLGTAFFHLIPESTFLYLEQTEALEFEEAHVDDHGHAHEEEHHEAHEGHDHTFLPAYFILLGIILFYFIEKFVSWHHHHDLECKHHSLTTLSLVGDAFHNFLDGILIAAAFMTNFAVGTATTIAIILHEIPQEIGDLSILLHGGFSKVKALLFNFGSALFSVAGAIVGFILFAAVSQYIPLFVAIIAGAFIYIALADIVPELHHGKHNASKFTITVLFLLGIGLSFVINVLIGH